MQKIVVVLGLCFLGLGCTQALEPNPIDTTVAAPQNSTQSGALGVRTNGNVLAMTTDTDGNTFIGGSFTTVNPISAPYFFSTDTDGEVTSSINIASGFNGPVYAVASLSDGSLVVGGAFTRYKGQVANYLAKLSAAGDLDTTFNPPGSANGVDYNVYSIAVSTTDDIYVGGCFYYYRNVQVNNVTRLDSNGNRNTTFSPSVGSTGTSGCVYSIAVSGTDVYLGGSFSTYRGSSIQNIIKVNSSGVLDGTFSGATGTNDTVKAVAVSGSDIYLGGEFTSYRGSTANYLAKVDTSGTLDTTFTTATGANDRVEAIAVDATHVYIGGYFSTYRSGAALGIAKLSVTNGNLDTTFSPTSGSNGFAHSVSAMMVDSIIILSGYLYVGGVFSSYRGSPANGAAKISTSGTLDTTFNPSSSGNGFNEHVYEIALANGKLYFGGSFDSYRGTLVNNIAKLDPMGYIDKNFIPTSGSVGTNQAVYALAYSNGALFAGGAFSSYRGGTANRVAKINPSSGELDTTYNPSSGANGVNSYVYAIAADDSNVYLGGIFSAYRSLTVNYIAKTDFNGVLDTTFNPTSGSQGFNSIVRAISIISSDIFVGGQFTTYRSAPANYIAKLSNTGVLDTTFSPSSGSNGFDGHVYAISSVGSSIFVGGAFSSYRSSSANKIAKVDATGTLDSTFNPSLGRNGFDGAVNALYGDGQHLYVGGDFSNYRGEAAIGLAKLDLFGNLSLEFIPTSGASGIAGRVYALCGRDNLVYVGGTMTSYQGAPAFYLITLDRSGERQ